MKTIKAFIKPHKLNNVTIALRKIEGLTGITVTDVKGFGRVIKKEDGTTIHDGLDDYRPIVKLELFCCNDKVDEIVSTIEKTAHTGLRGDGKIYVISVDEAVRISTGERGEEAI